MEHYDHKGTVNIFRHNGEWCYALFYGSNFDHSDTLDAGSDDDENRAGELAKLLFPDAQIVRVTDVVIPSSSGQCFEHLEDKHAAP